MKIENQTHTQKGENMTHTQNKADTQNREATMIKEQNYKSNHWIINGDGDLEVDGIAYHPYTMDAPFSALRRIAAGYEFSIGDYSEDSGLEEYDACNLLGLGTTVERIQMGEFPNEEESALEIDGDENIEHYRELTAGMEDGSYELSDTEKEKLGYNIADEIFGAELSEGEKVTIIECHFPHIRQMRLDRIFENAEKNKTGIFAESA